MGKPAAWSSQFNELAKQIMTYDSKYFAEIPPHMIAGFKSSCNLNVKEVTIVDLCQSFCRIQFNYSWSPEDLLNLLENILQSGCGSYLYNMRLIPLANGEWVQFGASSAPRIIYVENGTNQKSLLLGNVNDKFVDVQILSPTLSRLLISLAQSNTTQLRLFGAQYFQQEISLFARNPPKDYPGVNYLETLWTYLYHNFSNRLSTFSGLYLLPVSAAQIIKIPLPNEIVIENDGAGIDTVEKEVFTTLGITVIEKIDQCAMNHPQIRSLIFDCSIDGKLAAILKCFNTLGSAQFSTKVTRMTPDLKKELRKLLCTIPKHKIQQFLTLLMSVPIFEAINCANSNLVFLSTKIVKRAGPSFDFVLPLPSQIINKDAAYSETILQMIGNISFLTVANILKEILTQSINHNPIDKIEQFVDNCIQYGRNDSQLWQLLSKTSFVRTNTRGIVEPRALLDPTDSKMKALFESEDVFPVGRFSAANYLNDLKTLGMRNSSKLTDQEVIGVAKCIHSDPFKWHGKSVALLNFLNNNANVWSIVKQSLSSYSWVPVLIERVSQYPKDLFWKGSEESFTEYPHKIRANQYSLLCGSSCLIVAFPTKLIENKPSIQEVCSHLQACITFYSKQPKQQATGYLTSFYQKCFSSDKSNFKLILEKIYQYFQNDCLVPDVLQSLQENNILEWLFINDVFVSPNRCCFDVKFSNFPPYVYSIPSEYSQYHKLLKDCGVIQKCPYVDILKEMKERYDNQTVDTSSSIESDLQYAVSIINHLSQDTSNDFTELVLPIAGDNLIFLPLKECTYCDTKMLDKGIRLEDLEEENIRLIHANLSSQIAERLGVPSLLSVLLSDENFGFDTGFGQHESLTNRLRGLLYDYRDGLAVIKELIQNADDAKASAVKIVYDERKHEDYQTNLFDDKMQSLQGPALLAYNDAVFSEADFENVIKLGGETKKKDADKVGRFGLGFNSVYNLTEVPSFVSANFIVFFDPHKKYLGSIMRDKEQAGIKLDLRKRMVQRQLSVLSDQFHPFNGIFGCNLNPKSQNEYFNGTFFRFPLRNAEQAMTSEIFNQPYTADEMKKLLLLMYENQHLLLTFTQNVKCLEVFHLKNGVDLIPVFSVRKEVSECFESTSSTENILQSTKLMLSQGKPQINRSTIILHSIGEANSSFFSEFNIQKKVSDEKRFLICSSSGIKESFDFSLRNKEENLLPVGGVAFEIASNNQPVILNKSLIFCFLPLPIPKQLAFHINGYFAVSPSRTELCSMNDQDKIYKKAEWNELIMSDPVVDSCLTCLQILKQKWTTCNSKTEWYRLWPTVGLNSDLESNYIKVFVKSFYEAIVNRSDVCLLKGDNEYSCFNNCVFLEPNFNESPISDVAKRILSDILHRSDSTKIVVSIPQQVMQYLQQNCDKTQIDQREYSRERFYRDIVFANMHLINAKDYDSLLLWTLFDLDRSGSFMIELLRQMACIPASGSSKRFLQPAQLIDPSCKLSILFNEEDGRFPKWDKAYISSILEPFNISSGNEELVIVIYSKLRRLGMLHRSLPWNDLIERSSTVSVQDYSLGIKRSEMIVKMVDEKWKERSNPSPDQKAQLLSTQFLPTLQSNLKAKLPWNSGKSVSWCSPNEGFLEESKNLVFCSSPVIDFEKIDFGGVYKHHDLFTFFELRNKPVKYEKVDQQLSMSLEVLHLQTNDNSLITKELKIILRDILTYLENALTKGAVFQPSMNLKNEPIIYLEEFECFVKPTECVQTGQSFPPYIYSSERCKNTLLRLFSYLEIEQCHSAKRYVDTLKIINDESQDLTDDALKACVAIVKELTGLIKAKKIDVKSLPDIYIPDIKRKMQVVSDLCYNCCPWIEDDDFLFIHGDISYENAKLLGVKENRSRLLSKHQSGIGSPFGQKEKLSRRINTILSGYPFDESILKELLQNADDAGAKELHFILDSKTYEKEKLFSDDWAPLQGPALLIYNDKPFSKSDIEAIQNLGEGNKRDDPVKTGQYGVGFNSVYHLTDCPTFMTTVSDEGECLCAFDPLCKYVHGATEDRPGHRFDDIENLEKKFPDIFQCYRVVQSAIGSKKGTLFRLPLRTKKMAECPDLVDDKEGVSIDRVKRLFTQIFKFVREYLLFLKSVKSIKFSELRPDGTLNTLLQADAHLNSSSSDSVMEFNEHVKSQAIALKQNKCIKDASFKVVSYEMDVRTMTAGKTLQEDTWLIIKRFGFSSQQIFPEGLPDYYLEGSIGLLPLGGLATSLKGNTRQDNQSLFCLLPLPIKSKLPAHVNGHFALDYETRRSLSCKPIGKMWNNFLMQSIIAPLYLSLIETLKSHCPNENSLKQLKSFQSWYFENFPSFYDNENTECPIYCLTKEFYALLASSKKEIYPLLKKCLNEQDSVSLSWHALTLGEMGTVFNTLQSHFECHNKSITPNTTYLNRPSAYSSHHSAKKVEVHNNERFIVFSDLLKSFNMVLIDCPIRVINCFQNFRVDISITSPEKVLTYFSKHPSCQSIIGKPLKETPFNSFDTLKLVFDYIFESVKGLDSEAKNAPLMLSSDGIIRRLFSGKAIFSFNYQHLVPCRADLFAHRGLVSPRVEMGILKSFVSQLSLKDLGKYLVEVLQLEEFSGSTVSLEKLFNNVERRWFTDLWRFLFSNISDEVSKDENQTLLTNSLGEWSLVPVLQNGKELLLPIKQLKFVIDLQRATLLQQKALRKLNIFEPNYLIERHNAVISSSSALSNLSKLIGEFHQPKDILTALTIVSSAFSQSKLTVPEARELSSLFSSWLCNPQTFSGYHSLIRQIPMFVDVGDNIISVYHSSRIRTLPEDMPRVGMDQWSNSNDSIAFLAANVNWEPLYKFIGCTQMPVGDVYVDIVLPRLYEMSPEVQMEHLQFLKDTFQNKSKWEKMSRGQEILNILSDKAFIQDNSGVLRRANYFYNPLKKIFQLMIAEDKLLPKQPFSPDWFEFLIKLGLNDKMSDQHFLDFAKMIAKSPDTELKNSERSCELVKVLFNEQSKNIALLNKMKSLSFLSPHKVDQKLKNLAEQFNPSDCSLISFEHSAFCENDVLLWTQCNILPYSYSPEKHCPSNSKTVFDALGLLYDIPIDKVCHHMLALCSSVSKNNDSSFFITVLIKIFKHMKTIMSFSADLIKMLREAAIIPVEVKGVTSLVQPIHIVTRNLVEDDQIPPYLCKLPNNLGEFEDLFISLGGQKSVNTNSYAEVLYQYHKKSEGKILDPNEREIIAKATECFFQLLQNNDFVLERNILYFPSNMGRLHLSSEIFYIDDTSIKDAVKDFSEPIFYSLKNLFNFNSLFEKFPTNLRPIPLNKILKEEIESIEMTEDTGDTFNQIQEKVRSDLFFEGLIRICLHHNSGSKPEEFQYIKERLESLKIIPFVRYTTKLVYKSNTVKTREKQIVLDETSGSFVIYLHANPLECHKISIISFMIQYLLKILDLDSILYPDLQVIFNTDDHRIGEVLDALSVKEYSGDRPSDKFLFSCGDFVPQELQCLLVNVLGDNIEMGMFVAYQSFDPEDEDKPVFVVAKVLKITKNDDDNDLLTMVEIDLGSNGRIEVSTLYVFRFDRGNAQDFAYLTNRSTTMCLHDDPDQCLPEYISEYDIDEAKEEIRKTLRDAQKLDEKSYRQLIKRLLLKWHPDKNPRDVARCTDIFQFLQNEIDRAKSGNYDDLFANVNRRADFDKNCYPNAYSNFNNYGSSNSYGCYNGHNSGGRSQNNNSWSNHRGSYNTAAPEFNHSQPAQAKLWMRQVDCNLQAAAALSGTSLHEWICFTYRQAAELAMKAVNLATSGNQIESNNLVELCRNFSEVESCCRELQSMGSFLTFLYPNKVGSTTPHEVFTQNNSSRARELAQNIVNFAKMKVFKN